MTQPAVSANAVPDSMDWRQIQSALIGTSFSSEQHKLGGQGWDHLQHVDHSTGGDPHSLWRAAERFDLLASEIGQLRTQLQSRRNDLVGSGRWSGHAATAFDYTLKRLDRLIEEVARPLTGSRSYTVLLNTAGTALADAQNRIVELNRQGARWTAQRYEQLKAEWEGRAQGLPWGTQLAGPFPPEPAFTTGDGKKIYTPSAYPEVDQQITVAARGIMTQLITSYGRVISDLHQVGPDPALTSPTTSSPSGTPAARTASPTPDRPELSQPVPAPEAAPSPQPTVLPAHLPGAPDFSSAQLSLPASTPVGLPGFSGLGAPASVRVPESPGAPVLGSALDPTVGPSSGTPGIGAVPVSPALPGVVGMPVAVGAPTAPGADGRPGGATSRVGGFTSPTVPPSPRSPSPPDRPEIPGIPRLPGSPPVPIPPNDGLSALPPGRSPGVIGGPSAPEAPTFPFIGDPPGGPGPLPGGLGAPGIPQNLVVGSPPVGPGGPPGDPTGGPARPGNGIPPGVGAFGGLPMMPPGTPPGSSPGVRRPGSTEGPDRPGNGGSADGPEDDERVTWLIEDRDIWSVRDQITTHVITGFLVEVEDEATYVVDAAESAHGSTPLTAQTSHRYQSAY